MKAYVFNRFYTYGDKTMLEGELQEDNNLRRDQHLPSNCCGAWYGSINAMSECNYGIGISFSEQPLEEVTEDFYINSVKLADNLYMVIKHRTSEDAPSGPGYAEYDEDNYDEEE